jgi:hypothetical protein
VTTTTKPYVFVRPSPSVNIDISSNLDTVQGDRPTKSLCLVGRSLRQSNIKDEKITNLVAQNVLFSRDNIIISHYWYQTECNIRDNNVTSVTSVYISWQRGWRTDENIGFRHFVSWSVGQPTLVTPVTRPCYTVTLLHCYILSDIDTIQGVTNWRKHRDFVTSSLRQLLFFLSSSA